MVWLGLGICGSSYFSWGNISALHVGIMPAITNGLEENDISIGKAVGKLRVINYAAFIKAVIDIVTYRAFRVDV